MRINWIDLRDLLSRSYTCGYCGGSLASARGYSGKIGDKTIAHIYICHSCGNPTFFDDGERTQTPGVPFGHSVQNISDENIVKLYEEARNCCTTDSYTAAILCCRKLLMNIAVERKATKGKQFAYYVKYLANEGFVPPGGEKWVDHIRKRGNEANHEIALMERDDAKLLLSFTEMLLKFIYEFPEMIPKAKGDESRKIEVNNTPPATSGLPEKRLRGES